MLPMHIHFDPYSRLSLLRNGCSCFFTLQMLIPNSVKIGPVVLEKKITHDRRWRTGNNRRQPIAIGHLSDSSDLNSSIELSS